MGRVRRTLPQSSQLNDPGATSAQDVPGLTLALPRAGLYHITGFLPWTADSTSKNMSVGLVYSGTTTSLREAALGIETELLEIAKA